MKRIFAGLMAALSLIIAALSPDAPLHAQEPDQIVFDRGYEIGHLQWTPDSQAIVFAEETISSYAEQVSHYITYDLATRTLTRTPDWPLQPALNPFEKALFKPFGQFEVWARLFPSPNGRYVAYGHMEIPLSQYEDPYNAPSPTVAIADRESPGIFDSQQSVGSSASPRENFFVHWSADNSAFVVIALHYISSMDVYYGHIPNNDISQASVIPFSYPDRGGGILDHDKDDVYDISADGQTVLLSFRLSEREYHEDGSPGPFHHYRVLALWRPNAEQEFTVLDGFDADTVLAATFAPGDESRLLILDSSGIIEYDTRTGQYHYLPDEIPDLDADEDFAAFSPDGQWLAINQDRRTIYLIRPGSGCDANVVGLSGLRQAILHANDSGQPTTICLSGGTHIIYRPDNGINALPVISGHVTLDARGASLNRWQHLETLRYVEVAPGGYLFLRNITLQDGNAGAENGGAILNRGTTFIQESVLQNNRAYLGGAIDNQGELFIASSNLSQNEADMAGGAIRNAGHLELRFSDLDQNHAPGAHLTHHLTRVGGYGGALDNAPGSTSECFDCWFRENAARFGGVIRNKGDFRVTNAFMIENRAEVYGGGIYNPQGRLTLYHTFVEDSVVQPPFPGSAIISQGGGIWNGGELEMADRSTLFRNLVFYPPGGPRSSHSAIGGGLYQAGTGSAAISDTFSTNQAESGVGASIFSANGAISAHDSCFMVGDSNVVYIDSSEDADFTHNFWAIGEHLDSAGVHGIVIEPTGEPKGCGGYTYR